MFAALLYRLKTPRHRRVTIHDPRPYDPARMARAGYRSDCHVNAANAAQA